MNMIFDYIVVGAGSAGCVVANRLSEDQDVSVLILEAGGEGNHPNVHNPYKWSTLLGGELDWGYQTVAEPGYAGRQINCNRGKMLGGSSSLNAMIYIRGNQWDYDNWAAMGCDGWGFSDVLPYFLKSEHHERGNLPLHGQNGLLNVSTPKNVHPLLSAMVDAGVEMGLPRNPDFNGENQEGAGIYQFTVKDGKRHSTAEAFLRPALGRPNLQLLMDALVTRIIFDGTRASGISFLNDGIKQKAIAQREIILCGGAINSPQILLLSGLGPAKDLTELGIQVVIGLPGVGLNLQDHPTITTSWETSFPFFKGLDYALGGFFLYSGFTADEPAPDLQYHLTLAFDDAGRDVSGFKFNITQLRPESRGQVWLQSSNPENAPCIKFNYLTHPDDMQRMIAGVKHARRSAGSSALAKFRGNEISPGADVLEDDEIESFIRNEGWGIWHPVGTCKMGIDELSVVGPELKVHGIQGLRVADASIMPRIVSGNTNAPTIMIAEKAADLIKASW